MLNGTLRCMAFASFFSLLDSWQFFSRRIYHRVPRNIFMLQFPIHICSGFAVVQRSLSLPIAYRVRAASACSSAGAFCHPCSAFVESLFASIHTSHIVVLPKSFHMRLVSFHMYLAGIAMYLICRVFCHRPSTRLPWLPSYMAHNFHFFPPLNLYHSDCV